MTQWGLDTLFNPAKRHMDEEKRRLQSTREEIGDSSGGKRIDLESGKVVIARDADEAAESDDVDPDDATSSKAANDTSRVVPRRTSSTGKAEPARQATPRQPAREKSAREKSARGSGEPSAAEKRAAARRGRAPR